MLQPAPLCCYRLRQYLLLTLVAVSVLYLIFTATLFIYFGREEAESLRADEAAGLGFRSRFHFFKVAKSPLVDSSPTASKDNKRNKFRIVACAKVTSETPYLLEWLEFHRIQGVDKFVLYHDALPEDVSTVESALQLEQLPHLYRAVESMRCARDGDVDSLRCREDIIDVLPSSLLVPDAWNRLQSLTASTFMSHRLLQPLTVSDCLERYKDRTEYLVHIDIDEFMYSPKYPTLYDYLKVREKQRWKRDVFGRSVGIHVPSVNFGSSGVIWDFRNYWFADPATGRLHLYFDPRHSSLYQLMQRVAPRTTVANITQQLHELRLERLHHVNVYGAGFTPFVDYMRRVLERDFPGSVRNPRSVPGAPDALLSREKQKPTTTTTTQHPSVGAPMQPTPLSNVEKIFPFWDYVPPYANVSGEFPVVRQADLVDKATRLASNVQDPLLENESSFFSHVVPIDGSGGKVAIHNDGDRSAQYHQALRVFAQFYPLITEEQILRVTQRNLDGERSALNTKRVRAWLGVCEIPQTHRLDYLIETGEISHLTPAQQKVHLTQINSACSGSVPNTITQIGKTLYFANTLRRGDVSRRYGFLRGCRRPGVHDCSHWIVGGCIEYAKPEDEIRLDHHQFRSYERRTLMLPRWRGGPVGYSKSTNFTLLQSYFHTTRDESKLRFVPELRKRLLDFSLVPKLFEYELADTGKIQIYNIAISCSPLLLLSGQQIMCPKDKPYVGMDYLSLPPPTPYSPLAWCSDIPRMPSHKTWSAPLDLVKSFPQEAAVSTTQKMALNHTVFCPGYGELNCCDYNPNYTSYQTNQFGNSAYMMRSPLSNWADQFFSTS